jgi:hypothetical protein
MIERTRGGESWLVEEERWTMASITQFCMRAPYRAVVEDGRLAFPVVQPWYRSLPVSCLAGLDVTVDGDPVPAGDITVEVGGVERTLEECAAAHEAVWFIQDEATVRLRDVEVGEAARIGVHMTTRVPYIMVGPGIALPKHTVQEETFEVVSA